MSEPDLKTLAKQMLEAEMERNAQLTAELAEVERKMAEVDVKKENLMTNLAEAFHDDDGVDDDLDELIDNQTLLAESLDMALNIIKEGVDNAEASSGPDDSVFKFDEYTFMNYDVLEECLNNCQEDIELLAKENYESHRNFEEKIAQIDKECEELQNTRDTLSVVIHDLKQESKRLELKPNIRRLKQEIEILEQEIQELETNEKNQTQ